MASGTGGYLETAIAVIGGGFSGSALAINLARHDGPPVLLLHAREQAGFGLAYATTDKVHLLNVRAANMSALPDDPAHFTQWLAQQELDTPSCFVPRQTFGTYMSAMLQETRGAAPDRLALMQAEVVGIERRAAGFGLSLASGQSVRAEKVVLAMGNLPPSRPPGLGDLADSDIRYVADPWQADLAAGLRQTDHVLLLGTGLTAIDVALLLDAAGFRGRITALSRRGLLPRTHDESGPPPALPQPPQPSVRKIFRHLRTQAEAGGWRQAIDQLRPHTQHLWQRMGPEEQRRFLRHARPWWEVHRHRTAPQVAERITRMQAEGRFRVARGRVQGVETRADHLTLHVRAADGQARGVQAERIVNCTGPSANLAAASDPLLISLRENGLARVDALGLGLDTDHIGRVIDTSGRAARDLFAVGPLTRGTFWEITAVPDIRRQVWALARRLADAQWVGGEGL